MRVGKGPPTVVVYNVSYFSSPTSSGRALKVEIKKVLGIDEDFVVRRDDKGRPGTSLSCIVMILTISKRHNKLMPNARNILQSS